MVDLRKTQESIFLALVDSIAIQRNFPPRHNDETKIIANPSPAIYETTITVRKQSPTKHGDPSATLLNKPRPVKSVFCNSLLPHRHMKHVDQYFSPLQT